MNTARTPLDLQQRSDRAAASGLPTHNVRDRRGVVFPRGVIKAERDKRGWTQADLKRYTNLSEETISRAEHGHYISGDSAQNIAAAFSLSVASLLKHSETGDALAETDIPASVRSDVILRARGRCEFSDCDTVVVRTADGPLVNPGRFVRISLFANSGPASQLKSTEDVNFDSEQNVILLCEKHAQIVRTKPNKYTSAFLFAMASKKTAFLDRVTDEALLSPPLELDPEVISSEIRIGRVLDLINESHTAGPAKSDPHLREAARVLREIKDNPYTSPTADLIEALEFEIAITRMVNSYKRDHWQQGLKRAQRQLTKTTDSKRVSTVFLLSMVFVRDEYGIFEPPVRLSFIKQLLAKVDALIKKHESVEFDAFLLGYQSALLRWRGRLERGPAQQRTYGEAERSARKSYETYASCSALLQQSLIKFTQARSLPLNELERYAQQMSEASEILAGEELADYPAAIKYRPRFYRDIYEFSKAIESFNVAVSTGYNSEMARTAYILGESEAFIYSTSGDRGSLTEAEAFLHAAIALGYDHDRNFMSWISCRSLLDPEWFRVNLLRKLETDGDEIALMQILHDEARRVFGTSSFSHDILFGVDEVEFWNMLGRISRTALSDPERACRYYRIAERYPRPNFSTRLGLFRSYVQLGDFPNADRYLRLLRDTARAFHAPIVADEETKLAASR